MVEKDLGQIIPDITATATVDNTVGTPEVNITVEELEELGRLVNKFKFSFLHLKGEKGDKPQKGVDYYTPQEKEQFTTETKAVVTGEGSKQVSLINAETTKVIQQIKEIVAGNEATSNALTLSGKTRLEFEKETQGVAGGYSGTFPLTKATLNGIYLLPATGKFYVCIKEYNGGNLTAPNANFEELSVFKNRDKLDNLSNIEYKQLSISDNKNGVIIFNFYKINKAIFISIVGSNFQTEVIRNAGSVPEEFIPIDIVGVTLGNSYNSDYLIEIQKNGMINIYGNNTKLNNISLRTTVYFVR